MFLILINYKIYLENQNLTLIPTIEKTSNPTRKVIGKDSTEKGLYIIFFLGLIFILIGIIFILFYKNLLNEENSINETDVIDPLV